MCFDSKCTHSTEIATQFSAEEFCGRLLKLLRKIVDCSTEFKLKHLTLSTSYEEPWEERVDDTMGKEIIQLLTQITTNTTIKSLFIDPLWLKPEYNQFLRMWYCDPFGNCNIPKILDLNPSRMTAPPRVKKIAQYMKRSIYVAQIRQCDKLTNKY